MTSILTTLGLWMLQNTLAAAGLALVVSAACRFGKFSPAVRHGLWLLVLLKLVTPPLFELPLPLASLGMVSPSASPRQSVRGKTLIRIAAEQVYDFTDEGEQEIPSTEPESAAPSLADGGADVPASSLRAGTELVSAGRVPGARDDTDSGLKTENEPALAGDTPLLPLVFGGLWLGGMLTYLAIQSRRILNLRRIIRRGRREAGALSALVSHAAGELSVRPPPVFVVPEIPTPALCAWGPVSLLWPEGGAGPFSEAGSRAIVLHELAHLRRRDHWIGWLELLTGGVWWWNPLFWYVRHQLHENAELACDAWVVALLPEGRRAYAEALIDVAQGESNRPLAPALLGVADGSRKLMERRLIMIMRGKMRYQVPAIGLLGLGLVALATIPQWTIGQDPAVTVGGVASAAQDAFLDRDGEGSLPVQDEITFADASAAALPEAPPEQAGSILGEEPMPRRTADAPVKPARPAQAVPRGRHSSANAPAIDDPFAQAAAPAAATEAAPSPELLRRLEQKIATLQKEVNTLRGRERSPSNERLTPPSTKHLNLSSTDLPVDPRAKNPISGAPGYTVQPMMSQSRMATVPDTIDDPGVETIVMTRSTYKLPPGRAVILEKALRELFKLLYDDVEMKVKNDALQITAAQEDQTAIYHLIRLMERKGREPAKPSGETFNPPREVPRLNTLPRRNAAPPVSNRIEDPPDQSDLIESFRPSNDLRPLVPENETSFSAGSVDSTGTVSATDFTLPRPESSEREPRAPE